MRRIERLVSFAEFLAVGLVGPLQGAFDLALFADELDLPDFLQNLLPHVLCVGLRLLDEVGQLLGWLLTLYLLQELLKLGFASGKLLLGPSSRIASALLASDTSRSRQEGTASSGM